MITKSKLQNFLQRIETEMAKTHFKHYRNFKHYYLKCV